MERITFTVAMIVAALCFIAMAVFMPKDGTVSYCIISLWLTSLFIAIFAFIADILKRLNVFT